MLTGMSQLQPYGIGVVAANKLPSSHDIEVTDLERTPMLDGEITDNIEEYKGSGTSSSDASFDVEVETTASLKAKWLKLGCTNRVTSPDVRRGERVALWRFGDSDQFFWMDIETSTKLRRLETVVFSFSNNRKENVENTADTTYYFEVSTMNKLIHLHTSKNDDEPFAYDMQLNTKDGKFTLTDDEDNFIFLDSKEKIIHLRNSLDSYLKIDKKVITLRSDEEIILDSNKISFKGKNSIESYTNTFKVETSAYTLSSSSYQVSTPNAVFSSNVSLSGTISAGGYRGGHHG